MDRWPFSYLRHIIPLKELWLVIVFVNILCFTHFKGSSSGRIMRLFEERLAKVALCVYRNLAP